MSAISFLSMSKYKSGPTKKVEEKPWFLIALLLEWVLQNMVRHFVAHKLVQYKQIYETLFRQRITAGSGTDL